MDKRAVLFLSGISVAAAAYFLWRRFAPVSPRRFPPLRSDDLYYSHLSPEEVASRHLLDLNKATDAQLNTLGLDSDSLQRLIDNRPYRTKLELVSRMIVPENVYATIKDKVEVARGDEPVKTA